MNLVNPQVEFDGAIEELLVLPRVKETETSVQRQPASRVELTSTETPKFYPLFAQSQDNDFELTENKSSAESKTVVDVSTSIYSGDQNSGDQASGDEVLQASRFADGKNVVHLELNEVLELAIQRSEFFVDTSSFLSAGNQLLNDPQFLRSRYDLDMQKSSQQGVEAALAEFDTQIATGFQWGRNSVVQANSNLLSSDLLINDNGNFYGRLDKPITSGATVSVIHNLNYAGSSQNFTLDPRYTGYLRGELRQPLLAGRGQALTNISGPNSYRTGRQGRGVSLAEIAEQSAEIDFNLGARRLLKQTEELYWDYWLAFEVYQNQQAAADNSKELWSRIRNRAETGLTGGSAADEAQAEENYYRREALADSANAELEQAAERLAHLTGLEISPDTLLLLVDAPVQAPTTYDLDSAKLNGINHRVELQKQDLEIRSIELQLFAAKQLNRPQLDLVSGVQFNGLGDQLLGSENGVLPDFVDTDDVGWNVGFEFSMPVGFNRERLNERYLRLLLTKARSARRLQEKEILHEISYTSKSVEKWSRTRDSAQKRVAAAERRQSAVEADFEAGRTPLDLFLRAQDSVAQARIELARATTELTKSQLEFLFRQGVR